MTKPRISIDSNARQVLRNNPVIQSEVGRCFKRNGILVGNGMNNKLQSVRRYLFYDDMTLLVKLTIVFIKLGHRSTAQEPVLRKCLGIYQNRILIYHLSAQTEQALTVALLRSSIHSLIQGDYQPARNRA